jgi:hypothetical protein
LGKNILRCTFTGKKYLSCSPGQKKILAQSESSNPPSKIKWSAPNSKKKGLTHVVTGICPEKVFEP